MKNCVTEFLYSISHPTYTSLMKFDMQWYFLFVYNFG